MVRFVITPIIQQAIEEYGKRERLEVEKVMEGELVKGETLDGERLKGESAGEPTERSEEEEGKNEKRGKKEEKEIDEEKKENIENDTKKKRMGDGGTGKADTQVEHIEDQWPVDEQPIDQRSVDERPIDQWSVDGRPIDHQSTDEQPSTDQSHEPSSNQSPLSTSQFPPPQSSSPQPPFPYSSISHNFLIKISNRLIIVNPKYTLQHLIKGTTIYIPPKPKPIPKTKEYIQLMARLRNEQQELDYQRLVHPEKSIKSIDDIEDALTPGQEAKIVKEQLSTILNILISVISVGLATWFWAGSSAGLDLSTKTLLSLFTSILVLVAEVVVYLQYQNKIQEARVLERSKKEKKTVMNTYVYSKEQEANPVMIPEYKEDESIRHRNTKNKSTSDK